VFDKLKALFGKPKAEVADVALVAHPMVVHTTDSERIARHKNRLVRLQAMFAKASDPEQLASLAQEMERRKMALRNAGVQE